jgi:hypothetical protein
LTELSDAVHEILDTDVIDFGQRYGTTSLKGGEHLHKLHARFPKPVAIGSHQHATILE